MSFDNLRTLLNNPQRAAAPAGRYPVVLIDDDDAIRDSLTDLLQDDYQIIACASAREGVAAVDESVAAVIVDVRMPGEDGFWACSEIRKKTPDMPVIFYSAYQDVKDPYAIINEHRPFGYVTKGQDIEKLLETLRLAVKLQGMIISNRRLIARLQKLQGPGR